MNAPAPAASQQPSLAHRLAARADHARRMGYQGAAADIAEAIQALRDHDARAAELVKANNAEVNRRRAAEDLVRVRLEPGDTLLLRHDQTLSREMADRLTQHLRHTFGPDRAVLILPKQYELSAIQAKIPLPLPSPAATAGADGAGRGGGAEPQAVPPPQDPRPSAAHPAPFSAMVIRIAEDVLGGLLDTFEEEAARCALCGGAPDPDTGFIDESDHADTCPLYHIRVALKELDGCRRFARAQRQEQPARPAAAATTVDVTAASASNGPKAGDGNGHSSPADHIDHHTARPGIKNGGLCQAQ